MPRVYFFYDCAAPDRTSMGLPVLWSTVEQWLDPASPVPEVIANATADWRPKCPEVPFLPSYSLPADNEFWKTFPQHTLPSAPWSPIDPEQLSGELSAAEQQLSFTQKYRMSETIQDIRYGYRTPVLYTLPPLRARNSASAAVYGKQFTDSLAWWEKTDMSQARSTRHR